VKRDGDGTNMLFTTLQDWKYLIDQQGTDKYWLSDVDLTVTLTKKDVLLKKNVIEQ
jgi:hypothetical protein